MTATLHLDPGESVIMEVRKHWFVFFAYGAFLFVAAVVPPIFYETIVHFINIDVSIQGDFSSLVTFAYMLWLLILWMGFFVQWTNYYLDVWYVTQKRIIDVEQKSLFHREISSLRFDKIQDLTINVKGLLATFLNFGDVQVQTAAENSEDFHMTNAANPERVRQIIFSQHNREAEKTRPVNIVPENGEK
jgi:hypothetical protein